MTYQGTHRDTGRHPILRALAISVTLVLVAVVGTAVLTYRHLDNNITKSPAIELLPEADRPQLQSPATVAAQDEPTMPVNILIMGSDSRIGQKAVLGNTPGLSDTTILLHLSADRSRAYGVSIPRDLMVPRPACPGPEGSVIPAETIVQWNDAFSVGGEACTIAQFEAMTDIRVDHFVTVDFNGFTGMVDALGGVPVCLPQDVEDPIGDIYLKAGDYEVTGEQALDYVRVRHSIGTVDTGDIGRMKRQQAFMASMVKKAVSAGTLLNPMRLSNFLNAATESLTVDSGMRLSYLFGLGQQVSSIGLDKVRFLSMPFTTYEPDPNRLAPEESAATMWSRLRADKALGATFTKGAAKAANGSKAGGKKATEEERASAAADGLCA